MLGIRIRIQHFKWIQFRNPVFWWPKIWRKKNFLICIFLNTVTIKITIQYFDLKDNSASHNTKSSYEDDKNCSQRTDYTTILFSIQKIFFLLCFSYASGVLEVVSVHHWAGYPSRKVKKSRRHTIHTYTKRKSLLCATTTIPRWSIQWKRQSD